MEVSMRNDPSGGYSGPAWADFWLSAAQVEKELRCRVVVRLGGSKVRQTGCLVELVLVRALGRVNYHVIAQIDDFYPTTKHKTMPGLLISLLYQALELGIAFDKRDYKQLDLLELPLPPPSE